MVDGNDNAGGIATQIFVVGDGTNNSCHDKSPSSQVKLDVINSGPLNTCGFLSMHITGGKKPYTITVAETDTTKATANVTLGANDDQFDFLDTLKPGSQFVAAAMDANGVFSTSTELITTQGGSDTSCPGLASKSKTYSAGFPLPAIAGIVGGVVIICGLLWWWFVRRRRRQQNRKLSTDLLQVTPLSPRHQDDFSDAPNAHGITPYTFNDSQQPFDPYADHSQRPSHGGSKTHLSPNDGQAQLPGFPPGANVGAGSSSAPWSPSTNHPGREGSALFSDYGGAGSSSSGVVGPYGTSSSQQPLVLQHQDALDVVELPPAYRDRERQSIPGAPPRTEQRRRKN